ncbi:PD-(D/E)XK nuclease family protein [Desulfovibrio psychrotolerans]|uniref:PD-(D/E)XK endonuclease-like domain-containing protein n=1 Tax=Desulfovibrio psychrotolerans TaxID=415242 RepID=A0A7J0BRA8_9BACT|nr:PD-(D/E)XK nuclease family protein [Desulfovibrio psychrotolerans]GFM35675.1 hypothetical protein DSM19430T_03590 [Desulfovibrio psychrotolerans]
MRQNSPFIIIPWENDFLTALAGLVLEQTQGNPGNACIIMPHSRPGRYFSRTLLHMQTLPKPFVLPQMLTVNDLFRTLRAEMEGMPPEPLELLDRVGLLLDCVQQACPSGAGAETALPLPVQDANRFFPWGMRLASLLEDFHKQNLVPEDIAHMHGQVADFAADLLASLGRIHAAYTQRLDAGGWTTPGYDAFRVVRRLPQSGEQDHFACLRERRIFIAGFYGLTGVEEALFRHLWQHCGARIVLHTDARLAHDAAQEEGEAHWACREHARWATRWGARMETAQPAHPRQRSVIFHEGFDLHSQLDVLQRTLREQGTAEPSDVAEPIQSALSAKSGELPGLPELAEPAELELPPQPSQPTQTDGDAPQETQGTAVVLPDTGLLMPVLHHLPRRDVNISMGYPLGRSTLFRLLETVMRLQETARNGQYYWKELIRLLRHPYLKMLSLQGERPLGLMLHNMETAIRTGRRHTDPRTQHPDTDPHSAVPEADARALLHAVLDLTVTRWETLTTPADMADTLADLCSLLLAHGGDLWDRFPLDAESIFRLMRRVIPMLRECSLAHQPFPRDVLFTILRETIRLERVPFEADPLTGVQVLGMLETRLLRFDSLHILDATEDKLPGAPAHDPLLPDSLRAMLGLPDTRHREQVAAHNFHRLIHGANHVHIYYQAGVDRSGLFEEKKARSRFVEEMLWQEERARGALLKPGTPPLHAVTYPMPSPRHEDRPVLRSPAIAARLDEYLRRPLSPSALDTYLTCPVRFFHERLCGLSAIDQVNEGDDMAGIGELLHTVLETFFTPLTGRPVTFTEDDAERLKALFVRELYQSPIRDTLPYDSFIMLEEAGKIRLERFLKNQPATTVLALEQRMQAAVSVNGNTRFLAGRMDRVDSRDGNIIILDYKTGKVHRPHLAVWDDEDLWKRLRNWQGADDDTLERLAQAMPSVQLPAYLHVYSRTGMSGTSLPGIDQSGITQSGNVSSGIQTGSGDPVHDAGWVELRNEGKELFLLGTQMDDDTRETIIHTRIPQLMEFLFRHMEQAPVYRPIRGKHCQWCACANCCSV